MPRRDTTDDALRQAVFDQIEAAGGAITAPDLAAARGTDIHKAQNRLMRMYLRGVLVRYRTQAYPKPLYTYRLNPVARGDGDQAAHV